MPLDPQVVNVMEQLAALGLAGGAYGFGAGSQGQCQAAAAGAGAGGGYGGKPDDSGAGVGDSGQDLYAGRGGAVSGAGVVPRRRLGGGRPGFRRLDGAAIDGGFGLPGYLGGLPAGAGDKVPRAGGGLLPSDGVGGGQRRIAQRGRLQAGGGGATAPGATWRRRSA